MKYAVHDPITPEPISTYDTEEEAIKRAEELNACLIGKPYFVKLHNGGINITLSKEEANAIAGLCSAVIPHLQKTNESEKLAVIMSIQNKIR